MPLYDYRCAACGKVTEVRHGFDERLAEMCPACGGVLKRVFNPAPIVFKGSGFYVTDSRKKSGEASKPDAAKAEPAKADAAKGDAKATEGKPDPKPDPKPPKPPSSESAA